MNNDIEQNTCGVYGLHNTDQDMWYVGSSVNIHTRINAHLYYLKRDEHYNQDMQQDWNNGDQFEVVVLCECDEAELLRLEHEYMDIPNAYNKNPPFNNIPRKACELAWSRVRKTDNVDECWEWGGHVPKGGYGNLVYKGKYYAAHRLVYSYFHPHEDISHSVIRHMCNNKSCCNPNHLQPGSHADNSRDYWNSTDVSERSKWYSHLDTMVELRLQNLIYREIGKKLGCKDTTVLRLLQQHKPEVCALKMECSANNGSQPMLYEYQGKRLTQQQLLLLPECRVSKTRLAERLRSRWDVVEAVTTPHEIGQREIAFGDNKRLVDWPDDERCQCSVDQLRFRLGIGWTPEKAITTPMRPTRKLTEAQCLEIYIRYAFQGQPTGQLSKSGRLNSLTATILKKW
jgi:hypothetical protein